MRQKKPYQTLSSILKEDKNNKNLHPYDEWYSLNREELKAYLDEYPDVKPFPWQQTETTGNGDKK